MEVWSLGLEAEEDWIEEKNVFVRIAAGEQGMGKFSSICRLTSINGEK